MDRVLNKNWAYDPIEYESIDDIEFWIMEEDINTIHILDYNEIKKNIIFNEESISILGLDKDERVILRLCIFCHSMFDYKYDGVKKLVKIIA